MLLKALCLVSLFAGSAALKVELTDATFKKTIEGKDAILFFMAPWCGHCRSMQGDWDKLGKEYKDTPNVLIAQLDCAGAAQKTCGEYGVQGFPSLKVYKNGKISDFNGGRDFNSMKREVEKLNPRPACSLESKEACSPADRKVLEESEKMTKAERLAKIKEIETSAKEKREQAKVLEKEAKELTESLILIKAGGQKVEKVEQLLNHEEWEAHCDGRTCIVAFLPHIYDENAEARHATLKMIDEVMKASKKDGKNIGFLWSQGGDQFELEEKLGLQFGYPAVIAVHFGKQRFGVQRGIFSKDSLVEFLTSLSLGGFPLAKYPEGAKAVKADAWDGKDAAPPVEEEL